jgi:hypothetical protein
MFDCDLGLDPVAAASREATTIGTSRLTHTFLRARPAGQTRRFACLKVSTP